LLGLLAEKPPRSPLFNRRIYQATVCGPAIVDVH
jgi:hypothetical protein